MDRRRLEHSSLYVLDFLILFLNFKWCYKFYAALRSKVSFLAFEVGRHMAEAMLILFGDRLSNQKLRESGQPITKQNDL